MPVEKRGPLSLRATGLGEDSVANVRKATKTFTDLSVAYPDDAGIIAGLADSYLRAGTHLLSSEPFTARQDLKSDIVQYNRVSALGDPRDAALGIGRALIGLSEPADAVRLLRPYTRSSSVRGPPLEVLISAALIMAASTLLPVGPLDGAHLGKAGIVTGAGLVGGALLVGLSLI